MSCLLLSRRVLTLVAFAFLLVVPGVAGAAGPTVLQAPVTTAFYGKPIDIAVRAKCTNPMCTATVAYRETGLPSEATPPWTRVALKADAVDATGAIPFSGQIPGDAVTTRGVDYYIEVLDGASVAHEPAAGVESYHVHTVSPPVLSHVPPGYAVADKPLPVELRSTCSTSSCGAILYFRTTPSASSDEHTTGVTISIGDDPRSWEHVSMSRTATSSIGDPGRLETWAAQIPGRIVDTKGVDYVFSVSDGRTTSWAPGTSYEGYVPADGEPVSAFHAHVVEPPRIVHVPPTTGAYRKPIPISATSTCAIGRTCTGRLYYRTTASTALDDIDDFQSVAMTVTRGAGVADVGTVTATGAIPASVADTRGVDYFFSISDGSRSAWWPGTSPVDGPVSVDGARVAYSHVRVLEPPHIVAQQAPTAKQLQPLTLTATVTCATAHCDADLYYAQGSLNTAPLEPGREYTRLAMTKTADGPTTTLGTAQTYQAAIPAAHVTTRGIAWFIRAFDGHVQTFSPGTPYSGAYVPVGNRRPGSIQFSRSFPTDFSLTGGAGADHGIVDTGADLAWLTRVLEPPHIVHAPVATSAPDRQIAIDAYTNCITPSCTGELTWLDHTGQWRTATMAAAKVSGASVPDSFAADQTDVWRLSGVIPRTDVIDGTSLAYRISASDGYSSDTTQTYPVVVSDRGLASVHGRVYVAKAPSLYLDDDLNQAGVTVRATPVVNGTVAPTAAATDTTDADGRYTLSDLPSGEYEISVDGATLYAGSDPASQTLTYRVTVALGQRATRDFKLDAADRDSDELADVIEPRYGIPAGTNPDSDGDQLKDGFEVKKLYPETRPDKPDTDDNGTSDAHEDPDQDDLDNVDEQQHASDPKAKDSDGDGLRDGYEVHKLGAAADPTDDDTNDNGTLDGREDPDHDGLDNVGEQQYAVEPQVADTDADGLKDGFEALRAFPFARPDQANSAPGTPDGQADPDDDGVSNLAEQQHDSDPLSADGDKDDLTDSEEIAAGTDPGKADTDDDGLSDATEAHGSTGPTNPDTDGDGPRDGEDTTSSTVTEDGVSVTLTGKGDLAAALHIDPLNGGSEALAAPGLGQLGKTYDIHLDEDAKDGFDHATIKLPYDPSSIPTTAENLRVFTFDHAHQTWLPSSTDQSVDTSGHMVVAHVDHFSDYTLFDISNWYETWTSTVDGCHSNPPTVDLSLAFDVGYETKANDPGFSLAKETARRFVAALGGQDRGAVSEADDSYRTVTSLTNDQTALNAGINNIHDYYGRPTDLEQVIEGGLAPLKAGGPRQLHRARMMILLSSGHSDYSFSGFSVDDANLGNVAIFPIAIGPDVNESRLRQIAEDTRGSYHHINSTADLPDVLSRVTRQETHGDYDDDGVNDCDETDGLIDSATGKLFFSDPQKRDTDGDGLIDGEEAGTRGSTSDIDAYGTNLGAEAGSKPVYNIVSDPQKRDSDSDTLSDLSEYGSASGPRAFDTDGDLLNDKEEQDYNTLPYAYSTDLDDYSDSYEVDREDDGYDPLAYTRTTSRLHYAFEFAKGLTCGDLCGSDPEIPWLMGNISSGLLGYGDIVSFLGAAAHGDAIGAVISLGSLIPIAGDAVSAYLKAAKFAEQHPELADDVIVAINRIAGMRAATRERLIGELTDGVEDGGTRLARLRSKGATDEVIVAVARNRKSFADLDYLLVNADEVVTTGATATWLKTSDEAQQLITDEFGAVPEHLRQVRVDIDEGGTLVNRGREYDGYDPATGTAYEVKSGTQNEYLVRSEPAKDRAVLDNLDDYEGVNQVVWRFYARKDSTGRGYLGPDKDLMDKLLAIRRAHPGKFRIEVYLPSTPPIP